MSLDSFIQHVAGVQITLEEAAIGYGAWIDRSGNIHEVSSHEGHETFASGKTGIEDGAEATDELASRGWLRVVNMREEGISFNSWNNEPPTPAQIKALNQVADEHGGRLVQDLGKRNVRVFRESVSPFIDLFEAEDVSLDELFRRLTVVIALNKMGLSNYSWRSIDNDLVPRNGCPAW